MRFIPEYTHNPSEYRKCPKCKKHYLEVQFHGTDLCTVCRQRKKSASVEQRRELKSHRDAHAQRRRLKTYNLTQEQYDFLLVTQEHMCSICKNVEPTVIDHNHQTGEVRGLLCNACNTGIGLLKDDPLVLDRAIHYLLEPTYRYIDAQSENTT